jgi:hypothetical protein
MIRGLPPPTARPGGTGAKRQVGKGITCLPAKRKNIAGAMIGAGMSTKGWSSNGAKMRGVEVSTKGCSSKVPEVIPRSSQVSEVIPRSSSKVPEVSPRCRQVPEVIGSLRYLSRQVP